MIIPSILTFQHKEAHECIMPIGADTLDMGRSMDTTSTARSILLPGRARVDDITQDGTIIGVEYDTGIIGQSESIDKGQLKISCKPYKPEDNAILKESEYQHRKDKRIDNTPGSNFIILKIVNQYNGRYRKQV